LHKPLYIYNPLISNYKNGLKLTPLAL